jgi:urease accessory protein
MDALATLLVLADGRLPAGGHAHSGGVEASIAAGRVRDLTGLAAFLHGRLATAGRVASAFAAAAATAAADPSIVAALDEGLDARTASPALRRASRTQGRALLRAARAIWPPGVSRGKALDQPIPGDLHHAVALGLVAATAGLTPGQAGLTAAYGVLTAPATAAVRLLGLDPYAVHALVARLAPECDRLAAAAARTAGDPVDDLPADAAPLLDADAEHHATWEVRLFAS